MSEEGWRSGARQALAAKVNARESGREISEKIAAILDGVKSGAEHPVLELLLGADLSRLVRRTGWNTLVINPGSTSTKVAIFSGLELLAEDEVHLEPGASDGVEERTALIAEWAELRGFDLGELSGIAARGGFVAPVPVATYRVTEEMRADLTEAPFEHASNLAVPMALELGRLAGDHVVITITDPVTCDEVDLVHRITGSPRVRTDGTAAHYLNLRAVCELFAHTVGEARADLHLIACHMGGGMSAARCRGGRMVQVSHAFGTFPSANRSGSLPLKEVLRLIDDGDYSVRALRRDVIEGAGGLLGLTGTNDFRAFFRFRDAGATPEQREKIDLITDFFARRVAAGIMELAADEEPVDAVLLTGGLARDPLFCDRIADRLALPVPLVRIPGSLESQSLAAGLIRASEGSGGRRDYAEARDELAERRAEEDALLDVTIFERPVLKRAAGSPLRSLDEVIAAAHPDGDPPLIALIGADNEEALLAARMANRDGAPRLARFALIGPYGRISELAWELEIPIDEENYFAVDSDDPVATAVELYREGAASILMKGSQPTAAVLKGYLSVLKSRGGLKPDTTISHLSLCEVSGRPKLIAVTDAAINPEPDLETRIRILENALAGLRALGLARPKVAVISATEKPSRNVPSSVEGEEIAARYKDRDDVIVEGPLSVDLSLSPEVAREKRYPGRIQGDADLLLVPDLDVGNAVYKMFTVTGGATMAGAVVGGDTPLILTSRGDSARTKFASIALALVLAGKGDRT